MSAHADRDLGSLVPQLAVAVQDAQRLRGLARDQLYLQRFYEEHGMCVEAEGARADLMRLLRDARAAWRQALGLTA